MFAPLHIKTRFSPLGSLLSAEDVVQALQERRIPACAVRDDGTLYGAYAVRRAARGTGIRVAIGVDLPVSFVMRAGGELRAVLGILAVGVKGERALDRLVRLFWERKERGVDSLSLQDLRRERHDLRFVLSGSSGPVHACLRKGRLADAWKTATALYGAVGNHIVLETGRSGMEGEDLTGPFYREMASRFELPLLASSPVRYLRREDAAILRTVRRLSPEERVESENNHLPSPLAMRNRYGNDTPTIEATLGMVTLCTESGDTGTERETTRDSFIRTCMDRINTIYKNEPKWKREEIDRRFWNEYWKAEEDGNLDLVVSLAATIDRAAQAVNGASYRVNFMEGTLLAYLLSWTTIDPVRADLLAVNDHERSGKGIVIEGNRAFLRTLRSVLQSSNDPAYASLIEPQKLSQEDQRILTETLASAGKGAGHDPKKRSTHSLFEPHNRTNHRPVPSERMHTILNPSFVADYVVRRNRFTFRQSEEFGWTEEPTASIELRVSDLHEALHVTVQPVTTGDMVVPEWNADWVRLVSGKRDLRAAETTLQNESDWILMLEDGESARETLALVARVRDGEIPKPLVGSRIDEILADTEGIPVYREQFVRVIQAITGYTGERAERLLCKLQNDDPRMLARERHDFIAAVVVEGASSTYGDRVFSFLLAMAEHALPRARHAESAHLLRRLICTAQTDRDRFWARLVNGLQRDEDKGTRKVVRQWMALSAREGIEWKTVSINESSAECEVVEPGVIRQGLAGIPGLGRGEAFAILQARRAGGPFGSAADFLDRMLGSAISRPVLIRLARSLQDDGFRLERRGVRSLRKSGDDEAVARTEQVSLPFLNAVS
ncbi:MAG: PHP domain-containing protein [Gemmatimonadetes bacterium]|nr:PHP domain-containing protein [Gemmatimonadota bacterium]